ncbi:unnamed protein product [Callosobruchus maculatus]|uniref:Serine hydrolase domain-containing protein n=1 Tax=Callosobruchus maculatus TaxID=64391 RepID=A0A653DDB3_CALMS|nr:unnamed protein product [Callosobruchus maculatus]
MDNNPQIEQKCCSEDSMSQKLKVLAIHGYRQNGEKFREKTGKFRKTVRKWAQFTFITAPHKVIPVDDSNDLNKSEEPGQSQDEELYAWFFNRDDNTYRGIRDGGPAIGFEESVKLIEQIFTEEGPFDGLVGFSQGACFVGLLCAMQQRGLTKFNFGFAVLAAGFKSECFPHLKYYSDRINLPSLHIFGETDKINPTESSEALSNCFEDPVIVRHPGGHYLPASAAEKPQYRKFFELQLLRKQCKEQQVEKTV